ncbi:MAG: DUF1553 domain-containing protein [Planctomycetia bacterium]|nr:DUF1553 domain-containing protein [Planctomycetia bacterium]
MGFRTASTRGPCEAIRLAAAISCSLALFVLGLEAVAADTLGAAAGLPASATAQSADSVPKLDSEQQLIQRRASRLEQLPAPPTPPEVDAGAFNPIDQFIAAKWKSAPSQAEPQWCDDATFLRRVYLDVIGAIPTSTEANRFLASPANAAKRAKLIDQLLARHGDYAAHWTAFWEDALASQNVLATGGILTRGNYRDWLLSSFERNRPYDVMVAELLDPTMPGRKGPETEDVLGSKFSIEYVRNEDHTVTLQTAANVAQVFLGTSMKCASCHDHFENSEWPQDRFLGFAGLFAPSDLEHIRCELKSGKTVPARFPFELPGAPAEVPADLAGRLHLVAQSITDPANPRFAKTVVNRLWKRYLGLGLFEPADDFRLDSPASHPELLDWLAYDFVEHGCDLKHTIRLILTSRTYQLRYDPQLEDHFSAGQKNAARYYRSPSLRRLTAEQLLDSIRVATSGKWVPAELSFLDIRSTALTRALGRPAARSEISTARPDDAAVVQSLELLNGRELHEMIYANALFTEAAGRRDPRQLVDRLYRAALSRPATVAEKNAGKAFLQAADSPDEGLKDMLWALVCSPEFQYIK